MPLDQGLSGRQPSLRRYAAILLWAGLAVAMTASSAHANPAKFVAVKPAAEPKAMTWTVVGKQDGFIHVGSDKSTNAKTGDTAISQYRPALCLRADGMSPPAGIAFDRRNGWSQGAVKITAAIRGSALTSRVRGDELCARAFGAGWKLAGAHDGRHGKDLASPSASSFWAKGGLPRGVRFWVATDDQSAADAWASRSASAAAAPLSALPGDDTDYLLKTYLHQAVQPLLWAAQDGQFHGFAANAVGRQFDGDDNVLLWDLVNEAEAAQIVVPSDLEWIRLKETLHQFANVNGRSYAPQLGIPNLGDGVYPGNHVTMTVYETDLTRTVLPAFELDGNGDVVFRDAAIDETYAESNEVWVLSVNEPLESGSDPILTAAKTGVAGPTSSERATSAAAATTAVACNTNGLRNNRGEEYLRRFTVPNPEDVEHWTSGKLEPRLVVVGKGGLEIKNVSFGKIKRKNIRHWVYTDMFLTTWDREQLGDYWAYKWVELDAGPKIEISLGFEIAILKKLGIPIEFDVKATFEGKHDDMGSGLVNVDESTHREYTTGTVNWNVCTSGGIGAPPSPNFAIGATVGASSTYPYQGYSPSRVNDGSADTTVGGDFSWTNADEHRPPQWVQLDFGVNRTFRKVVVYTSAGYEIQDFDVEGWNGGGWTKLGSVRGNTALEVTVTFPAFTGRTVRIHGLQGPAKQPWFVRVNEFQVFAN